MSPWTIGKGWIRLGTFALIGTLLLGTAVAASASGASGGQIMACVRQGAAAGGPGAPAGHAKAGGAKSGGVMYVVTSASQCTSPHELLLTFPTEDAFVAVLQQQAADVASIAALQSAEQADVTAVVAGTGLAAGGTPTSPTVGLAPAYRLPQGCTTGQVAEYDATSATWGCATPPSGGASTLGSPQTFTASGTYTFPAGVTEVAVEVIGAGGGGGGQTTVGTTRVYGAGGGGGAVVLGTLTATDCPDGIAVTVGQGGMGSPTGQFSGLPSSVRCGTAAALIAGGGSGADETNADTGGAGGTGSSEGTAVVTADDPGQAGAAGTTTVPGDGGNNGLGTGGGVYLGSTPGPGGGGAGGDPATEVAQSGGNGVVIITPLG
jgi:hypothetical protein